MRTVHFAGWYRMETACGLKGRRITGYISGEWDGVTCRQCLKWRDDQLPSGCLTCEALWQRQTSAAAAE